MHFHQGILNFIIVRIRFTVFVSKPEKTNWILGWTIQLTWSYLTGHHGNGLHSIRFRSNLFTCWWATTCPLSGPSPCGSAFHWSHIDTISSTCQTSVFGSMVHSSARAARGTFFVVGRRHVITLSNWTFVLRVMLGLSARHGCFVVLGNAVASVLVMRLVGFNSQSALFTGEVTKLSFFTPRSVFNSSVDLQRCKSFCRTEKPKHWAWCSFVAIAWFLRCCRRGGSIFTHHRKLTPTSYNPPPI